MVPSYDKTRQFRLTPKEFFSKLDFLNWHRYFVILKEVGRLKPRAVLEVGPGEGTIRRVCEPYVKRYATLDRNSKLGVDYVGDVRTLLPKLREKFDAVIAADILEHIPFKDVERALQNIWSYLRPGGYALLTIPHRAWFVSFTTWLWNYHPFLLRAPDWLRITTHRIVKRRDPPIDPDHEWEIGDGTHRAQDVERVMQRIGFTRKEYEKLSYVDFWVLRK